MQKDEEQKKEQAIQATETILDPSRQTKVSFGYQKPRKIEVYSDSSQSSSNAGDADKQDKQEKPVPIGNLHPLLPIPNPAGRGKSLGPRKSIWQDQLKKRMSYLPSQQLYRYGVSFSQHRQRTEQIAFLSRAREKMMKAEANLADIIGEAITSNPSVEQPISVRLVPEAETFTRKQQCATTSENFWKATQSNTVHVNMAQFSMTSSQNNSFFSRSSPKATPLSSLHCTNTAFNFHQFKHRKNVSLNKKMNFNFRKVQNQMQKNVKRVLPTYPLSKLKAPHTSQENTENKLLEFQKPLLTEEPKTCSSTQPTSCNTSDHFKPQLLPTDIIKNIKASFFTRKRVDDYRLATIYRDWSFQPSSDDQRIQCRVPLHRLEKPNKRRPHPTLMQRNIKEIQNRCQFTRYQIYEMFSIFNALRKDTEHYEKNKKLQRKFCKKWEVYKKSLSIMLDIYPEIIEKTTNKMLVYGDPFVWLENFENFLNFVRQVRKDNQKFKLTELTEVLNLQNLQLPGSLYSWKQGKV